MTRYAFLPVLALAAVGCSRPPDLSRVLGHTPEEVRDYLGDPLESSPESEDYRFQKIRLGVIYRNGRAVSLVTLGSSVWTEQQFRDWLGTNCVLELESRAFPGMEPPPPGVEVGFSATVRPPCTPRVY
jgi:hypothetical protein